MSKTTKVKKYFKNTDEMLDYLENLQSDDEDIEKVYLEPPDDGLVSDEDSGDEDGGGFMDNLGKKQLQAPCELVCNINGDEITIEDELRNTDDDIANLIEDVLENSFRNIKTDLLSVSPSPSSRRAPDIRGKELTENKSNKITEKIAVRKINRKRQNTTKDTESKAKIKKVHKSQLIWAESTTGKSKPFFPEPNYTDCSGLLPHQQFEKFIDDEVLQMLCDESNTYSVQVDGQNPNITVCEMKVFIGIMIITGYTSRPKKRDYWCEDSDMLCSMVSESMRRNRFETIFRYMHFKDNSLEDREDKIWKIRPFTDAVKRRCLNNFHPEQDLSYDESMVEYYGRHGCKQFIRGKPLRFGYKMWCLNTPQGYLINYEMYQGINPRIPEEYPNMYGKNSAPLFSMLDDLDGDKRQLSYCIYFDNLFTSLRVLLGLVQRGYNGTGTMREIMLPKSCPLPDKKVLKKKPRGHIESIKIEDCGIYITKWIDNSVVTIASTIHGKNPVSKVGRYSREQRKKIDVPRPYAVAMYNASMGGTDRMDQNVNAYRISARGKKWWWSIFTWLIDVSVQNAWILHRKTGSNMTQIDFRREICSHYCNSFGVRKPPGGYRRPKFEEELSNKRYDGIDHYVEIVPENKRRRCKGYNCATVCITMCGKCNVGLCAKCFKRYHFLSIN